jgi:putative redox protein
MNTIIARIGKTKYETELSNGTHHLIGDEPTPEGADKGPSPYDYLMMALGSCTAMTVRMYADRKNWDLEEVEVHLTQDRVHAKDCEDCESSEGYVHKIRKELRFKGNLDEKQITRLKDISAKCPVHRTMENEIRIESELVG